VNARGVARSTYWPSRSGSHYIKRGIDRAVSPNERSASHGGRCIRYPTYSAGNELAAEWLKEIPPR
jgi:hypothetical protein